MSVGILNDTSFGNVLKTLCSPSIRDDKYGIKTCEVMGMKFYSPRTPDDYDKLRDAIRLFVQRCIFFNHEAYRLRYSTDEVCEPITSEQLDALERMGKVVSFAQLFMTLCCIDYNSDVRDHLGNGEVYPLQETFDEWHKTLESLTNDCAEAIAWEQADKEKCVWF